MGKEARTYTVHYHLKGEEPTRENHKIAKVIATSVSAARNKGKVNGWVIESISYTIRSKSPFRKR